MARSKRKPETEVLERRPIGRPSSYTPQIAATICERMALGESLRGICADEGMPDKTTVLRWLLSEDHSDFRTQYTRSRDAQADSLVEECLEIADDGTNDWMERKGADGQSLGWQINGEHVNRSRLRVDTRKWWAARLAPKKYGDQIDVPPRETVNLNVTVLAQRIAYLLMADDGQQPVEIEGKILP